MNASPPTGRLLVGLTVVALLGGCASGTGPTMTPTSASPSSGAATPAPIVAAAATPAPTPGVVVTSDVAYESGNPVLAPGVLDVYAPAKAGPWPVVVMFHPLPSEVSKDSLAEPARRVADLGFVVLVPARGHASDGRYGSAGGAPTYDQLLAQNSQAACAVGFARAHAAEYGGDPATMIVFGWSAGAMVGAMVAFARPEPSAGCLAGTTLGAIDALITWEGDWILSNPALGWDGLLAADPRLLANDTPWPHLAQDNDLKVVMLVSDHPGAQFERKVSDPGVADSFFAVRDPSGVLRGQLEASGALVDGLFDFGDGQRLLFSALQAQGNPISLDVMPGSTHYTLSDAGWKVLLAAFGKAVAQD
jgi:dienelactone hydrolase